MGGMGARPCSVFKAIKAIKAITYRK